MQSMFGVPYVHIGIDGSAIEHEDLFLQEAIEVGAGEELRGDLAAGNRIDRGLPVVFEPDDKAHPVGVTGA